MHLEVDHLASNSLPSAAVVGDEATARNIVATEAMTASHNVSIGLAPFPGPAVRPGFSPKGPDVATETQLPTCFTFEHQRIRTVKGAPWLLVVDMRRRIGLVADKRGYGAYLDKLHPGEFRRMSDTGQKLSGSGMHHERDVLAAAT